MPSQGDLAERGRGEGFKEEAPGAGGSRRDPPRSPQACGPDDTLTLDLWPLNCELQRRGSRCTGQHPPKPCGHRSPHSSASDKCP